MKQLIFSACIVATLGLVACNEQEPAAGTSATTQAETEALLVNTQPASPGASAAQTASVAVQPATSAQQASQQATKGSTQAAKTAAGMNPAHGEPGHRCDIPVGAPLSTPAGATQAAPTIQPVQASPAAAPAKPAATGGGKINPPHGEPGHDCAVPVGAPLK